MLEVTEVMVLNRVVVDVFVVVASMVVVVVGESDSSGSSGSNGGCLYFILVKWVISQRVAI